MLTQFGRSLLIKFSTNSAAKALYPVRTMSDTLFTKIIKREIPSEIVHEDEKSIAIRDINPKAPIHVLVIPKKPLPGIADAKDDDTELLGHLMTVVRKVAEKEKLEKGYRIVINQGADGGQEVPHLHIHLFGGRQMKWPPG